MKDLVKKLELILTIDGSGRPEKAKRLLELLNSVPQEELRAAIEELSKRKHF